MSDLWGMAIISEDGHAVKNIPISVNAARCSIMLNRLLDLLPPGTTPEEPAEIPDTIARPDAFFYLTEFLEMQKNRPPFKIMKPLDDIDLRNCGCDEWAADWVDSFIKDDEPDWPLLFDIFKAADFLGAELVQEVLAAKIASPFRIWTDEQQEAIFSPSLYLEASSNSKKSSSDASSDEETEPDADRAPFGGASTTPGSASSALSGPRSRALSRLGGGFGGGASDREQLQRLAAEAEKRLVAGNVLLQGDERAEALVREKYPWTMREPHVEAVLDAGVARRERQWGAGILSPARVALEARERGEKMRRRSLARSLLAAGSGVDETQAATDDGALEGEKVPPEARAVRRIGERDVAEGTGIGRSSLEETTEEVHPPEQREEMALGSQAAATLVEEGSMVGPVTSEESEGIAEVQETDAIPQSNNNVSQNDEEVSSTLEKEVENSNNSSVNSVEVPHSKESAQEAPSIVETQDKTPTEQGDSAAPSEDVSPPSVANASGNGPSSRKMLSGFRLKARQKKPAVVAETGDSA